MKKIILIISLLIISYWNILDIYAADPAPNEVNNSWNTPPDAWVQLKVRVTEQVPWALCEPAKDKNWNNELESDWSQLYECTVQRWFWTIKSTIGSIIKYATFITWLAWVLYIIVNWIMLSMSWLEQSMKENAKKNIQKVLVWLILLLLSWVILNLIAPWVYQ